jgi:small subunit ribosomal protein S20
MIKRLKALTTKKEAVEMLPSVVGRIDKLAKKNIIHRNKAAHQKSKLAKLVNGLS